VGSIGDAGAFSFYPAKNIGCFGDGGMAVTNDEAVAAKIAMLRNYGEAKKYEHLYLAYNRRLDTVQAAVLKVKLPFLDRWNAERRTAAQLYRQALAGTSLVLPPDCAGAGAAGGDEHVYYMFVVRSKRRDELAAALKARNIETGIHYPFPLHLLPVFQDLGHRAGDFPVAEGLAREALSLPIFPGITEDEIARVADAVRAFERGS
jgi:dTDP-4-amino-4,6-dideoxygalactose transaminase